jgi:signal transduction histidine kinase
MIGFLHTDNLLSGKPLSPQQMELLRLYASSLGHLCALKRAETSLRRVQDHLQIAAEAARMGLWVWHIADDTLAEVGHSAFSTHPNGPPGTLAEALMRHHVEDREMIKSRIDDALRGKKDFAAEFRTVFADGSIHWVLSRGRVLRNPAGEPVSMVGIDLDITQQKLAEQERERMQVQLFNAQKLESLGVLVGGISHDFSNLLTIIEGNVHLLQQNGNLTADQLRSLMDVETAARQATEMARSLQSFSKPPRPEIRQIDANKLVQDVYRLIRRLYPTTIEFKLNLWEDPCSIAADPGQLQQVLVNLCVNARDAMPGGGTLTIETRPVPREELPPDVPHSEAEERYILIRVTDTGCGMDQNTLRQAFDPFFTTKPKDLGTGLGLAVVHKIVTAHSGYISIQSRPGEGTQVDLFFPCLANDEPSAEPSHAPSSQGRESLLLVEDEEMIASLLRTALESRGYTVTVARDPESAIRLAEKPEHKFALAVVDYSMPKLTGDRCLVQLRRTQPDMRALLITGHNLNVTDLATRELYLLKKPFSLPELASKVRELLDADRQLAGGFEE